MIKVTPIIPKNLSMFLPAKHKAAIERTMALGVAAAQAEVVSLTRDWSSSPAVNVSTRGDVTLIAIVDQRWIFNDLGTKAHIITPRNKKFLKFEVGGSEVFTKRVRHPGTKAQYLTKKVQARVNALKLAQTFTNLVSK